MWQDLDRSPTPSTRRLRSTLPSRPGPLALPALLSRLLLLPRSLSIGLCQPCVHIHSNGHGSRGVNDPQQPPPSTLPLPTRHPSSTDGVTQSRAGSVYVIILGRSTTSPGHRRLVHAGSTRHHRATSQARPLVAATRLQPDRPTVEEGQVIRLSPLVSIASGLVPRPLRRRIVKFSPPKLVKQQAVVILRLPPPLMIYPRQTSLKRSPEGQKWTEETSRGWRLRTKSYRTRNQRVWLSVHNDPSQPKLRPYLRHPTLVLAGVLQLLDRHPDAWPRKPPGEH